eukprot:7382923-Prymnesium_polylepis.1
MHHSTSSAKGANSFAFVVICGDVEAIMAATHVIDGHQVRARNSSPVTHRRPRCEVTLHLRAHRGEATTLFAKAPP